MTRTMLWKTSWLGQEPAETRPCLGPAAEPPSWEALQSPPVGKEKGQLPDFLLGVRRSDVETVLASLCEPLSVGPELGRWGRFGQVPPELSWLLPY